MKRSNRLVILVGVLLAVLAFVAIVILLNQRENPDVAPEETTETIHVHAHGATWVEAVYTNEAATVDLMVAKFEGWLEEEEIKFIDLKEPWYS